MTSLGFLLMRVLRNQPPLKAVCRSLGCLNYEEAFFRLLESLSIQSSDLRIDSAPDKHVNWGWAKCSGGGDHFSHLGSVASNGFTSCRNYRRDILVAFWPKHGLRSNLRVPTLKLFFWGSMPPHTLSLFTLMHVLVCHHNGCTTLK